MSSVSTTKSSVSANIEEFVINNSIVQSLKRELKRLWSLKKFEIVPVVVGALGCISKGFNGWMDTLGIKLNFRMVQKSVLMGTASILRKVLDM